jgi:hypothetical protein
MLFAHLKRHLGFERLRLRGLFGARDRDSSEPQTIGQDPLAGRNQARSLRRLGKTTAGEAATSLAMSDADRSTLASAIENNPSDCEQFVAS